MKKTKVVATIGPSCMKYETLKAMCVSGLNMVRINLSHAKQPDMDEIIKNVKRARKELNIPLPVMIDTRGPEIRVKTFKGGSALIKRGQIFTFTARDVEGSNEVVSLNEPAIVKSIKPGNKILAVNGLIKFNVLEVKGKDVITKALNSGVIANRKSLFLPGVKFNTPYLNAADKADILWGIKNDVDFVATSFVNSRQDVLDLKNFIAQNGGDIKIIAKIESALGVKNLDEIIIESDAVMVARGDLGVEMPMERLPELQKTIIKKATAMGKATITATEMLESMITNNRATRAEVSDVANAVYDGTSAVMLSGETAMGKYPVEAVKTMSNVCVETERHINYYKNFCANQNKLKNTTDVVSHSAVNASFLQQTKAIVGFTTTGLTAIMVSKFRPATTIVGATPSEKVFRQLELFWGVKPILTRVYNSTDDMFKIAGELVKKHGFAKPNDTIVITCGTPKQLGCTNLLKIDVVK